MQSTLHVEILNTKTPTQLQECMVVIDNVLRTLIDCEEIDNNYLL